MVIEAGAVEEIIVKLNIDWIPSSLLESKGRGWC
jgi:hypothetical protein